MPKLTIDQREIEVPTGTKVIVAAEGLGIMIPRFCYHPALGPVGACRLCAVKFVEGPVRGVQMSCMVDAMDGMVVSTTDEEAVEFRKYVIEWSMLHHPHDCPVCDEGGHCLLQDATVSGGHGLRRYLGEKRTYLDQYLGPFVQHEMNRCIHCFRCRRFYQEFAGYRDLGAMQIGHRTYFGRFCDGPLESPFAGNLIDLCPTGVYTDKPARYKGRRWDLERGPSVCPHCSLGCNTITSARYREVVRQEARLNEAVNGYFICDRGRFGYDFANQPDRPRRPRVGKDGVAWEEALRASAEELTRICGIHGPTAVACLSSTRSSLETLGHLQRLCRLQGWPEPALFMDPALQRKAEEAVSRLDARLVVSMRELEGADFVLGVSADPLNEAPMLALAMRQVCRRGGGVAMIDPRPLSLPFEFDHLPAAVGGIDRCLTALMKGALHRAEVEESAPEALSLYDAIPTEYAAPPSLQGRLLEVSEKLRKSRKPVIVCGTDIVGEATPALAADLALLLRATRGEAGLFFLLPGANAYGAALLSSSGWTAERIIEDIERGTVRAVLVVECDPFGLFPDRRRLSLAVDRLEMLMVLDYLPSLSVQRAHIVLPTKTLFEGGGCFVNQEGRVQFASRIHAGGLPISQSGGGQHPPRRFLSEIPGGEPEAAGVVLSKLASALSPLGRPESDEDIWTWLAAQEPLFADLPRSAEGSHGARLVRAGRADRFFTLRRFSPEDVGEAPVDELELLMVDWTFGTEELAGCSRFIQEAEEVPRITMHRLDVHRLGLADAGAVTIHLPGGALRLALQAADNMATGVAVIPRHRQLDWQKLEGRSTRIPVNALERS